MIRNLFIFTGIAAVVSIACLCGAAGVVSHDLGDHGWQWSMVKDGNHVHFQKAAAAADPSVSRDLTWDGGDTLVLDVPADVTFTQGKAASVTVTGPSSLVDRVRLSDGRLTYTDGPDRKEVVNFSIGPNGIDAREDSDTLKISIVAPSVTTFNAAGDGDLTVRDFDQPNLELNLSGDGDVTISGVTKALKVSSSGDGDADLGGLRAGDADIDLSSDGDVTAAPTGKVNVSVSGDGDANLTTNPASLSTHTSGNGEIHGPDSDDDDDDDHDAHGSVNLSLSGSGSVN